MRHALAIGNTLREWVRRRLPHFAVSLGRTEQTAALVVRLTLAAIVAYALAAGSAWADRVALVIGNSIYQVAGTLTNPSRDAAAISARLEAMGFGVTQVLDADLSGMRSALARFGADARGAEIAVVFYAGHGIQADGENYLIPVDARIAARADLETATLRASEVFAQLMDSGPEVALVILDACRNNPFLASAGTSPGLASGSISASAFVQRPNSAGMIIGFAAAPGAVAYDGAEGNSPYTTALLQWIDRPGLELGTMLRRVRGTVLELTGGAQVPWVEEALLREVYLQPAAPGDLVPADAPERLQMALLETIRAMPSVHEQDAALAFFERLVGTEAADRLTVASASAIGQPTQDEALLRAGLIWLSIRDSQDVSILQSYRDTFPDSPFAELALARIESVRVAQSTSPVLATYAVPVPSAPPGSPEVPAAPSVSVAPVVSGAPAAPAVPQVAIGPTVMADLPEVLPGAAATSGAPQPVGLAAGSTTTPLLAAPVVPGDSADRPNDRPAPLIASAVPATDSVPLVDAPPPDAPTAEAALGLTREDLAAIQTLLAQGGEYTGPVDGLIGPASRASLMAFQRASGAPATGYLDQPLLRRLVAARAGAALRVEPDSARRLAIHRVSAVAAGGAGAQPTTLRVAALSRNDDVHAYWEELARGFEADFPGTLVEFSHQPDWAYKANILGQLGSDTPPDLIHTWGGGHLDALRQAGFTRDLTDEMAAGWAMEFRPGALANFTSGGAIHAAPSFVALVSLWVNEPMLARAGIPLAQLETWDGFLRAVGQLQSQGIVPLAVGGRDAWPFQMIWGNLALALGGREAFAAAYAGTGLGFADPVFVEASARLQALGAMQPFQPGYLDMDEAAAGNAFARGETAMVITGNWRLHSMGWNWPGLHAAMQQELRRVDFPGLSAAGTLAPTYGGVDGYAVRAGAPDIAVDLLRLLSSREVQVRIAELSTAIPSSAGADLTLTDPLVADVAQTLLTSGYHQLYYDQALGPVAGDVVNAVSLGLATGRIDPATATAEIARAWDAVLLDRGTVPNAMQQP